MPIRLCGVGFLLFVLACAPPGGGVASDIAQQGASDATPDAPTAPELEDVSSATAETSVENPEFFLFDGSVPDGKLRDPLLKLKAEKARVDGDSRRFRVDNVKGVIFRTDADDLEFEARTGTYDDDAKNIELEGPIRLQFEGMVGDLNDMQWDSVSREVRSSKHNKFHGENMEIQSESMVLQPSSGRLELKDLEVEFDLNGDEE